MKQRSYDVVIVGSGVGGGVVARNLAEQGVSVLLLERGGVLPREDDNWSVEATFNQKKIYRTRHLVRQGGGAIPACDLLLGRRQFEVLRRQHGPLTSAGLRGTVA